MNRLSRILMLKPFTSFRRSADLVRPKPPGLRLESLDSRDMPSLSVMITPSAAYLGAGMSETYTATPSGGSGNYAYL